MRVFVRAVFAAAMAFTLPAAAAPLEAYGRLPSIEAVKISPDGQNLALVVTNGDQRKIVIQNIQSHEMIGVINAGQQKIRDVRWGGPHHVIVTASQTAFITDTTGGREEHFLATDYNVATRIQRALLSFSTSQTDLNLNVIYGYPTVRIVDGRALALVEGVHFVGNEGHLSLFKVDLDRDDASIQSIGQTNTRAFVVDARGMELAESEYNAPASRWDLKVWRGHWQDVERKQASIERPELLGLGRDGVSVLVGFHEVDRVVLRELSADGATWSDPLPVADPDGLIWDPATDKLIGEKQLSGDDTHYIFFNPQDQAIWKGMTAAYPDARVGFVSMSDDHEKWVLRVDSPTEGPAFALVDLDTKKGSWIGDEYLGLKAADIAPVTPVSFAAKDGLRLTGYLTLPRVKTAKGLPLIVLPHGGPAVRDRPGFDWWAQALASRGYAVLQVNYRGSDGFGWAFQSQGFGQWGRKMQTDLSDGVRYLAGQRTIDPARVCIVGGSYGGYAALAGAAIDTGVYRCAVSVAGVADVRKLVSREKALEGDRGVATERYWVRYMGAEETLGEISPALHADNVTIPVLLIHGKDDTVVPYAQSQMMADALRKAGKPVEFVTLSHEDHWLSSGETRLEMLRATVAFLEKNNPPN